MIKYNNKVCTYVVNYFENKFYKFANVWIEFIKKKKNCRCILYFCLYIQNTVRAIMLRHEYNYILLVQRIYYIKTLINYLLRIISFKITLLLKYQRIILRNLNNWTINAIIKYHDTYLI